MAKIPTFKRIYKTDYPVEQQALIDKLSLTINNGFEVVYNALARALTLRDNIACTVRTLNLKVDSGGIPTSATSFKLDTTGQIILIEVGNPRNLTNSSTYPTSGITISYSQDSTLVTIDHITGLTNGDNWEITIIAWA